MYAYFVGKLKKIENNNIILEVNNIGYNIFMTYRGIESIRGKKEDLKIYVYFQVREDAQSLFGFYSLDEKKMFEKLISISKVGAKTAIGILGNIDPTNFALAVVSGDIKTLSSLPGIGKKTAERIVLELKDKLDTETILNSSSKIDIDIPSNIVSEAESALKILGFNQKEVDSVIVKASKKAKTSEDVIKNALKLLSD